MRDRGQYCDSAIQQTSEAILQTGDNVNIHSSSPEHSELEDPHPVARMCACRQLFDADCFRAIAFDPLLSSRSQWLKWHVAVDDQLTIGQRGVLDAASARQNKPHCCRRGL